MTLGCTKPIAPYAALVEILRVLAADPLRRMLIQIRALPLAVVIYLPDDHRERAMATKQFTPPNPRQPTASEAMRPTDSSNFYRCDQCPALSDAALAARYKLDAAQLHDLAL